MAQPKQSETSKNRIYVELHRSIILGYRRAGTKLDIEALADTFGTSVTPVRDALQMLNQEGLVTIKPRSGYYVTRFTLKQLHEMLELREILEVAAIERAAPRITDEWIEQLERVHAGYTGDDDESQDRYVSENRRFHCLVAQVSGNHELAEMIGHLHDRMMRFMVLGSTRETTDQRHKRIIEALRTRDPQIARQAMLNELNETRNATLEKVIQEEGDTWHLGTPLRGD